MPEPFPPQTWPEGATPTVDQLKTWIRTFEDHHDARVAADMIAGMLGVAQRHVVTVEALGRKYADRADRYRSAWRSARRRAASKTMQHAHALEALTMLMTESRRNRLAWLSARARARGIRAAALRFARWG